MPMKDPSHPVWKIATMAVAGVIMVVMLNVNYENGWAPADYLTVLVTLLGVGGVQVTQSLFGRRG